MMSLGLERLRSDMAAIRGFTKTLWLHLSPPVRRSLVLNASGRVLLSLVDLAGTLLIAVLLALLLWSSSGSTANPATRYLLEVWGLSFQEVTLLLVSIAISLFVAKAWLGLSMSRKLAHTLNGYGAQSSSNLWKSITRLPIDRIAEIDRANLNFALSAGVNSSLQAATALVTLISDAALVVLLVIVLVVSSPFTALVLISYMAVLLIAVDLLSGRRVQMYGSMQGSATESLNRVILETLSTFRERTVLGRMESSRERFFQLRHDMARAGTSFEWLSQVPRYVTEFGLLLILAVLVVITALVPRDGPPSLELLVFYVAAARLVPAVGPIQSSLIAFRLHSGLSETYFTTLKKVGPVSEPPITTTRAAATRAASDSLLPVSERPDSGEGYSVLLQDVSFSYPETGLQLLDHVDLSVNSGERVAIIGESGSGKTTLVDILLGLINPIKGNVAIQGHSAAQIRESHPATIAYVPQSVSLVHGTLAENVALGIDRDKIDMVRVQFALTCAQLAHFESQLDDGVFTILGDGARPVSGGQLQRLGVARALYNRPRLLVMDESTSALDAGTETRVLAALHEIQGMTVIFIAHSPGPLSFCTRVFQLSHGRLTLFQGGAIV